MPTLGLIMIVRNEARNLPRSLGPVAGLFDQVLVLDTGSTDSTKDLARQMGAIVHDWPWRDDFAQARNRSIELSRSDWLMWLDADNSINDPENSIARLRRLLPAAPAIIWGMERVSHSGEALWQKRVFPREPGVGFRGLVHEQLVHPPGWPNLASQLLIDHWGYEDPAKVREKGVYYLGLLQKTLQDSPADFYARFQAARCYFNLRQFVEAERELQLAGQHDDRRHLDLTDHIGIMRATALERLGRGEEAFTLLLRLSEERPQSALVFFSAGKLAYARGDYHAARTMLEQSLALDLGAPLLDLNPIRTRFIANYLLGLALDKTGRPEDALTSLGRAIELDPMHRGVRLDLAEILWKLGKKDNAFLQLAFVEKRQPGDNRARRLARKWKEA